MVPTATTKLFSVTVHWTKFCSQCDIRDVVCPPCWMFCNFCTFSYRFNITNACKSCI